MVSNSWLRQRFGGTLLPHVRDTDHLDPGRSSRQALRRERGFDTRLWIGFVGTPRPHKGVDDLVRAVARVEEAGLLLAGVDEADGHARQVLRIAGDLLGERFRVVPPFAFDELPNVLSLVDIVCLPTRDEPASRGQTPAKLIDAMSMALPIVATDTNDARRIIGDAGVVVPAGDTHALQQALEGLLADESRRELLGSAARARAISHYSYTEGRRVLEAALAEIALGTLE
jgi:glycosyltransferase involved in cell wall biosynthesis